MLFPPATRMTVYKGHRAFKLASFQSNAVNPFLKKNTNSQPILKPVLRLSNFNKPDENRRSRSRLFGTKRGTPGNPPGKIGIYNEQETLPDINIQKLEQTIAIIRDILGYPTYDITLILVDDDEMRKTNLDSRGIDKPTDILSFPFEGCAEEPGILYEPEIDIPDYYNLGDMMVDVPYVMRRIEEDRTLNEHTEHSEESDVEDEEEYVDDDYVGDDDRGVSGAMEFIYDPEKRIQLLMVHGMLHLVGYDHIEDDDYELMVNREEEVMVELEDRITNCR
jgi:probable rRNA maturation factor